MKTREIDLGKLFSIKTFRIPGDFRFDSVNIAVFFAFMVIGLILHKVAKTHQSERN